jgi:hypothetical protein
MRRTQRVHRRECRLAWREREFRGFRSRSCTGCAAGIAVRAAKKKWDPHKLIQFFCCDLLAVFSLAHGRCLVIEIVSSYPDIDASFFVAALQRI